MNLGQIIISTVEKLRIKILIAKKICKRRFKEFCACKIEVKCVDARAMSQLINMRPRVNYTVFEHIIIIGLRVAASRHDLNMIWT